MPDMPNTPAGYRRLGLLVIASSIVPATIAALIYAGILEIPEETRPLIAGVLVAVTVFDVLAGVWFFSRGQNS